MTIGSAEVKQEISLTQEKKEEPKTQQIQENQEQKKPEDKKDEEKSEDPNWKAFREARKKDRADKEAAEKRAADKEAEAAALKAAMEAAFARTSQQHQNPYQEIQQEETEEARIQRLVREEIVKRDQEYARQQQQREMQEYPQRLNQNYPDFGKTVSTENLDYLDYHYPEIARTLNRLPDGYDKWSDVYHAIKRFVPNSTTSNKEAQRAENNLSKPKSISSTGLSQPTSGMGSNRLTEERKSSNWQRMQRIMNGLE